MAKSPQALATPALLFWARKTSGFTPEDAAKKIGIDMELLRDSESGSRRLSLAQLRKAATVYKRPLAIFYLPEPPLGFTIPHDYRRMSNTHAIDEAPGLLWEIRQAHTRRAVALELADQENMGQFSYLGLVSITDDPDTVAQKIREWLNIRLENQSECRDYNNALNFWKDAIERLNVLVFHSNHQGVIMSLDDARGFSISAEKYPVIVLNSKDVPPARIFSLLHEFVHVVMNNGGICNDFDIDSSPANENQRIEVFCNRVAGATLVPADELIRNKVVMSYRGQSEWDDVDILSLAHTFWVSREVILRRALILGLINEGFYRRKRADYQEEYRRRREQKAEEEEGGRSGFAPFHRMALRRNGRFFTRIVLDAYSQDAITLSDVADFLDVRLSHLSNIEKAIYGSA